MKDWSTSSRDFMRNATIEQVSNAVGFLQEWFVKNLGKDSVTVTPWDETGRHYTIEVIAPNATAAIPVYVGVNSASNQIASPKDVLEDICFFLADPGTNAVMIAQDANDWEIQSDMRWFKRLAQEIGTMLGKKRRVASTRESLSAV